MWKQGEQGIRTPTSPIRKLLTPGLTKGVDRDRGWELGITAAVGKQLLSIHSVKGPLPGRTSGTQI